MSHIDTILARFDAMDRFLVSRNFPPTSPWWRRTIERFYRSKKRQAVLRVGRRGGKSSTLSRLAVVEGLYGEHRIPPGDIGVCAVISTRGPEAIERLRTITTILDALGVAYKPSRGNVDGVELLDRPIAFRVHVATIAGVSGFTGVFILCDEVAKWKDADTGINPATEVIRSVRPTMATQPNARIVLSSSPMGTLDAHYDAFEQGETRLQTTAHAPSWVANPTLTEEGTRDEEPDEVIWAREYKAIPQSEHERSLLSAVVVERAMARWTKHEPSELYRYTGAIDPATRRNAWTFALGTTDADGTKRIARHAQWQGTRAKPLVIRATLLDVKKHIEPFGIRHVITDQFSPDAMRELSQGTGVHLTMEAWTQALYAEAFEELKTNANQDRLILPDDPLVKQDLLGVRVKMTRNGEIYDLAETPDGRHSDYAPVIAMSLLRSKIRAKLPVRELSIQEQHEQQRNAWLLQRTKDRERREKFGALPATHRKPPSFR